MINKKKVLLIGLSICMVWIFILGSALAAERPLRTTWPYPVYIDPAVGSNGASCAAQVNLYDALVYPDTEGKANPHIAKSWEISADGLTYTFHLRPGIKFVDGTELTAEDVKFSMDRLKVIGEGFAFLYDVVSSVEVFDKYTVDFHLKNTFGPFISTLFKFFILSKDLVMANIKTPGPYDDMGDYGKEYLLTHSAGSGPYMVDKFELSEYLYMVQNPNYWISFDPNAPDEFHMILTTEPITVKTMMSRRELEITDVNQPVEALDALEKMEGIDVIGFSVGGMYYYMLHTKKPPTDDIHFRKALAWVMDYDVVTNNIFIGSTQAKGPVAQSIPGADPTVFQYYQDFDKAIEELKLSKYYDQLDEYPVTIYHSATHVDSEKVALQFMSDAAKIGIKVKVEKTPWGSIEERAAKLETSPNILSCFVNPHYSEAGAILSVRYGSDSVATWEQNEWLLDPKFDSALEDAFKTIDEEERFEKYRELQHYIVELCPTIFLTDYSERHAYQASYVDWPTARGEVTPVSGYYFAARFIKIFPEKRAELLK